MRKNDLVLFATIDGKGGVVSRSVRAHELGKSTILLVNETCPDHHLGKYRVEFDYVFLIENIFDEHAWIDALKKGLKSSPTQIGNYQDRIWHVMWKVGETLGIPQQEGEIRTRVKSLFRESIKNSKVPTVGFKIIKTRKDILSFKESNQFPLIIKPLSGAASDLVYKVIDFNDLLRRYEHIMAVFADRKKNRGLQKISFKNQTIDLLNDLIVEDFASGEEFSVEGFVSDGKIQILGFCEKLFNEKSSGLPITEHAYYISGRSAISSMKAMLSEVCRNALKSVGLSNSAFHIEFRWNKDSKKLCIIEINPRVGGGFINEMVIATQGVDLRRVAIDLILKNSIDIAIEQNYHSTMMMLFPPPYREVTVTKVVGVESINKLDSVFKMELVYSKGVFISDNDEECDLLRILLCEKNNRDVLKDATKISKSVLFEFERDGHSLKTKNFHSEPYSKRLESDPFL